MELRGAADLAPPLPEPDASPEGFPFERVDLDALNEMSVSATRPFDGVDPPSSADALHRGTRPSPEGPARATGQRALSYASPAVHSYALVSGATVAQWTDASDGAPPDGCSNVRVTLDGAGMSAAVDALVAGA